MESATATPNRLAGDDRRAQLLELGVELFAERAFDAVSIDDVARRAGIAKGLLYHYFPSKRDFYVAVIRSAADAMSALTEPDAAQPPAQQLRQALFAYLDFAENHAEGFRALLQGGIGSDPEVRAIVDSTRTLFVRRMLAGMQLDPPTPAMRAALRGWIGMVEAASLDWLEHRDLSREQLASLLRRSLGSAIAHARELDP